MLPFSSRKMANAVSNYDSLSWDLYDAENNCLDFAELLRTGIF
jgi:hypothetical protein